MTLAQKLAGAMALWTIGILMLIGTADLELYGIFLLIGLLIARELTTSLSKQKIRERMDVMIYVGVLLFIVVVSRRILDILGVI